MTTPIMATYARLPVTFSRGQGAWLWDKEGRAYLDAVAGVSVCGLGHAHPAVAEALCHQSRQLLHTSNLYEIELQNQLGAALTQMAQMDRVFFANSGAEANEAAIKLARRYAHHIRAIDTPAIVVTEHSFHGRTLATLSATGNGKIQAGFEPLVNGFLRVPFGDHQALAELAAHRPNIVAVLVEPIQGEGGVNVPPPDYLRRIREICDEHQWLMMLDEIQTGMGRTGRMFAFEHEDSVPDVLTLAKSLGNGVPIGACLARGPAAEVLTPGSHGSTFGGNPLACAAALAVIETLVDQSLAAHAQHLGVHILKGLGERLGTLSGVRDIRGKGLMIGIELDRPCTELAKEALHRGLLINVTAERVIRLLPPLVISNNEADQIVKQVSELVHDFLHART